MKTLASLLSPLFSFAVMALIASKCSSEKVEAAAISIPELQCVSCEDNIRSALKDFKGIASVEVDAEKNIAQVQFISSITSLDDIRKRIAEAGYTADGVETTAEAIAKLPDCCQPPK